MRILRCHIESFGCLENYDINFEDGLNTILEENGWGKSTLAVFIKAMLYGLPNKTRDLNTNERKKYAPWSGGVFGGYLEFEAGGKSYRVERFFGASEKKDSFSLFDMDSGKLSGDFGEDLGFELLGIDSEAFERSIYISQRIIPLSTDNKSINAKLNGLIKDEDDIRSFDLASKKLESRRKFYSVSGGRGAIADTEKDIARLSRDIDDINNKISLISDKKSRINGMRGDITEFDKELQKLREGIEAGAAAESRAALVSHYEALYKKRDELKSELSGFADVYASALPDLDRLMDMNTDMLLEISAADSAMPGPEDIEKLKVLRERAENAPSPRDADAYIDSLNKLDELADRASALENEIGRADAAQRKKTGLFLPCSLIVLCIAVCLYAFTRSTPALIGALALSVVLVLVWLLN